MKKIELARMAIENFKGIGRLEMRFDGMDASVYGDNATGKTSLYDAFLWLLFDKDSAGRKTYCVKPLDRLGAVRDPGAVTSVEAALAIDGRTVTLRKTYHEVWTRKRGQMDAEFTGNTSEYEVDGVPVSAGEYAKRVGGWITEDLFRVVTSPRMFNGMDKNDKRKLLLDMAGAVDMTPILAGDFADLACEMGTYSADEFKAVIQQRIKKANQKLKELPVRVDEALRGRDDAAEAALDVETRLAEARAELDAIGRMGAAGDERRRAELESELRALASKVSALSADNAAHKSEAARMARDAAEKALGPLRAEVRAAADDVDVVDRALRAEKANCAEAEASMARLRAAWATANDLKWTGSEECPTCGQALPAEQVSAAKAAFNTSRANAMAGAQTTGLEIKAANDKRAETIRTLEAQSVAARERADAARNAYEAASKNVGAPVATPDMPGYAESLGALIERRGELQRELDAMLTDRKQADMTREAQKRAADARVQQCARIVAARQNNAAIAERVEQLRAEHKEAGALLEQSETMLNRCEAFIQACMEMTESHVGMMFRLVRFKLFERQINGGIADVCYATVDGVPYDALNNAMQINAGLDIIAALSAHYGVSAPIFVDNAEAVVALMPPEDAQVIRLVVSAGDNALRMELDGADRRIA